MRDRHPHRRHVALPLAGAVLLLGVALAVAAATAATAALPPALVERLEGDRTRAQAELERAHGRLATDASTHRELTALASRYDARVEQAGGVFALVAGDGADDHDLLDQLRAARDAARGRATAATRRLERSTDVAADLQGRVLDADRRLRAVQRAASSEREVDPDLGSYRFGSGGPAVGAESIDRYLQSKGSPMAGQGAAFLEAGIEFEVDPRLVVAIAGAESYFGVTTCAPHNAWGWGCPASPFRFASWSEGIRAVTEGLRTGYLDDGLETVGEIHLRYAPPAATNDPDGLNYGWADNVAGFLVEQGGDPQSVAGILRPSR